MGLKSAKFIVFRILPPCQHRSFISPSASIRSAAQPASHTREPPAMSKIKMAEARSTKVLMKHPVFEAVRGPFWLSLDC